MGQGATTQRGTKSIFDYNVSDAKGADLALSSLKGKKCYIVVNVASQCGLTHSNYTELTALYDKYKEQGLEILAFPCNNFGKQEPGSAEEVCSFASKKYKAAFPILGKVECENGDQTHPLWKMLRDETSGGFGGLFGNSFKWNFTKILCDANGIPVQRFGPMDKPLTMEDAIAELLKLESATPSASSG